MKKNAFTLVELLAVIAILAILIIIALPNILKMFNNAKKNSFVSEARSVYKTAEQKFVTGEGGEVCFSSDPNDDWCEELDMTGRKNFDYYVQFNESGEIESIHMYDGNYCISADVYYDNLDSDYVEIDYLTSEITEEGYDCRPCGLGGEC